MNYLEFKEVHEKEIKKQYFNRYKNLFFKVVSRSKWNNCILKCVYIWSGENMARLEIPNTNRTISLKYSVLEESKIKKSFLTDKILKEQEELNNKKKDKKPATRVFRDFNELTLNIDDIIYFLSYNHLHLGKIIYFNGGFVGIKRIKSKKRESQSRRASEKEIIKIENTENQIIKIQDPTYALLVQ